MRMDDRAWVEEKSSEIAERAAPTVQYFLLVALSCALATLGLITNSVAVIIGAMLVAPLIGPLMGISLASIRDEPRMYRQSGVALLGGVLLAIVLSALLAIGARRLPFDALSDLPSEVLIRAHPSFFDLGVALAGGAAGAYATVRMKDAAAVIGVAIATAIMPPLCCVGIGLAVTDRDVAQGAFLLFLTNLVAITFAALIVFFGLGFRTHGRVWQAMQTLIAALGVVFLTVLLSLLTIRTVNDARQEGRVRRAVNSALAEVLPGSELLALTRESSGERLQLRLRVQVPGSATERDVGVIQQSIADDLRRPVELTFVGVPTLVLKSVSPSNSATPTATPSQPPTASPTPTPTSTRAPSPTPSPLPTSAPTAPPTPPLVGSGLAVD